LFPTAWPVSLIQDKGSRLTLLLRITDTLLPKVNGACCKTRHTNKDIKIQGRLRISVFADLCRLVNQMTDNTMIKEDSQKDRRPAVAIDHRNGERRKVPAQGFAYISMVGWICRRERCRRRGERLVADQPTRNPSAASVKRCPTPR
jgi:hypothetical protein